MRTWSGWGGRSSSSWGSPVNDGIAVSQPYHRFPEPGGSERTQEDTSERRSEYTRAPEDSGGHSRTRLTSGSEADMDEGARKNGLTAAHEQNRNENALHRCGAEAGRLRDGL